MVIDAIPKNATNPSTGTLPPSLMRGHLFHGPASSADIYLYGGTSYMGNRSFPSYTTPDPSTYPLWTYNTTEPVWNQHDLNLPWRPNHGAATESIDQGLGFYLNGQIDWGTSTSTLNIARNETQYRPLDGMIVLNFNNFTASNISTPGIRGNAARVGGGLEYFAPIGAMGALIALGGQINTDNKYWLNSSQGSLINFTAVDVFDINSYLQNPKSNGSWYQQETNGDIPPARIDFCTVAMSAPDNSSHHIYLYGGRDPTTADPAKIDPFASYDDVYVLSLPSFTWTAIFTGGQSPRWGHSCHRVGQRQMVTVGGNITRNNGQCDWELKGVAFLDMTTVTWGSVFLPNTSSYQVPQKLFGVTGGIGSGNATIKEPAKGWTNQSLKTVFNTPRKWNSESNNQNPPTKATPEVKKSNTGAIAGGVVGGVVGVALVVGVFFLWKRRRNRAQKPRELENNEIDHHEVGADEGKAKYELPGINEANPAELPGAEIAELYARREAVEADRTTSPARDAAELSSENFAAGGRPGIPFLRTPDDELPSPPLHMPGLSPPLSDINTLPPEIPKQDNPPRTTNP